MTNSSNKDQAIFVDLVDVDAEIPTYGSAKKCNKENCPHPNFESGYGMAVGGMGPYEYCDVCDRVVSKDNEIGNQGE